MLISPRTRRLSGIRSAALAGLLALGASAPGCRAMDPKSAPAVHDLRAIERTLESLYQSFCFDAGGQADWTTMRTLLVDGASFVAPVRPGRTPSALNTDQFIEDFRDWIASSSEGKSGFHERIEHLRIEVYGHMAHAYVVFVGFVPGEDGVQKRGVDSIQLSRAGERWLVASFATQYASDELPVPARLKGE